MHPLAQDQAHLAGAIRLAQTHSRAGHGGPFGAVIVADGKIIARGWNKVTSANDPTAHAEVTAIRAACRKLKTFQLRDCVLYSSCEPCPMCLAACYWARLDRLVYAASRADAAAIGFDDDFLYREIPLPPARRRLRAAQSLRDEAREVMRAWFADPDRVPY
jgi:guanine deaminase